MHDFLVEIVGALCALAALGIAGGISLAIRTRGALSDCAQRISQAEKEAEGLARAIDRVESGAAEGRKKLHDRLDRQNEDVMGSIRHLEATLTTRLEAIATMIQDYATSHTELAARVEIMDVRGTRYLQETQDRGRREK